MVAVDTESNSLHAYRERVCLIQFSTPDADYIVDPIRLADLGRSRPFFANPDQQKVFHAAEYDLICLRRDYRFEFANIFDTMSAARTLGWPQVGLAAILETRFGVTMNKKYQRADWKRRPLTPEQLDYARLDTHYLVALRDRQLQALTESGRWAEAHEEFERLARLRADPDSARPDPPAFWRVKGARDLTPAQAAVLQDALRVPRTAGRAPGSPAVQGDGRGRRCWSSPAARRAAPKICRSVPGMTPEQIHRHGHGLLQAIEEGLRAPGQFMPQVDREPDEVRDRYDRLHTWRKDRARARGVESDVILPRTALWDLARRPPRTRDELAQITDFGPWRRETYGEEILALLSN